MVSLWKITRVKASPGYMRNMAWPCRRRWSTWEGEVPNQRAPQLPLSEPLGSDAFIIGHVWRHRYLIFGSLQYLAFEWRQGFVPSACHTSKTRSFLLQCLSRWSDFRKWNARTKSYNQVWHFAWSKITLLKTLPFSTGATLIQYGSKVLVITLFSVEAVIGRILGHPIHIDFLLHYPLSAPLSKNE